MFEFGQVELTARKHHSRLQLHMPPGFQDFQIRTQAYQFRRWLPSTPEMPCTAQHLRGELGTLLFVAKGAFAGSSLLLPHP